MSHYFDFSARPRNLTAEMDFETGSSLRVVLYKHRETILLQALVWIRSIFSLLTFLIFDLPHRATLTFQARP
jgi:hypothetical protein